MKCGCLYSEFICLSFSGVMIRSLGSGLLIRSGLKHLKPLWMDCSDLLCRPSLFPEDGTKLKALSCEGTAWRQKKLTLGVGLFVIEFCKREEAEVISTIKFPSTAVESISPRRPPRQASIIAKLRIDSAEEPDTDGPRVHISKLGPI